MAQMDVLATILKTGEQRIYPEKVFEAICDDPDNPLKFEEYVEIPKDGMPSIQIQQTPPPEVHSQLLIDALLKERQSKQVLEDRIKELEALQVLEPEKKKVGRPAKEIIA